MSCYCLSTGGTRTYLVSGTFSFSPASFPLFSHQTAEEAFRDYWITPQNAEESTTCGKILEREVKLTEEYFFLSFFRLVFWYAFIQVLRRSWWNCTSVMCSSNNLITHLILTFPPSWLCVPHQALTSASLGASCQTYLKSSLGETRLKQFEQSPLLELFSKVQCN